MPVQSLKGHKTLSGCSRSAVEELDAIFGKACVAIAKACSTHYEHVTTSLGKLLCDDGTELSSWLRVTQQAFEQFYRAGTASLLERLVEQVRAAQLRHSTPPSSSLDPLDTRHFAPHILSFLQTAFNAHPTRKLNKTERKELARAAGLSEKQVSTWFGNERQREKRRRERETSGSSGSMLTVQQPHKRTTSARSVPYDIEMAPHRQRDASYERKQQQQSRSWSSSSFGSNSNLGSSMSSSSSSSWSAASGSSVHLVEYAESTTESQIWPTGSEFSHPIGDLVVGPSTVSEYSALDPSGWFSAASSSTATREAAPSPTSPPLLVLPPVLDPNAPTPSSWSSTCASSPSLTFSDSFDPTPELLALEYPFPVTVPAPADAWMDEEFYRNLFGSLGLEMDGSTCGGSAVVGDGFEALLGGIGGFAGAEGAMTASRAGGGGITLSMDELRQDGEEMLML